MASVRLLDKVKNYKTADWDKHYADLVKNLKPFRQEIGELQEKQDAINAVSLLDGYISLPVVMEILSEIQIINFAQISKTFSDLSGKDIKLVIGKEKLREVFKKALKKDLRAIFEKLCDMPIKELSEDAVRTVINETAENILNNWMFRYLKDGITPERAREIMLPMIYTEIYLICALELYNETNARQTAGSIYILKLMAPYIAMGKEKAYEALQTPFIAMRECAKLVQVNVETGKLWREVSVWLKGLYLRSFLQVPERYRRDGQVIKAENGLMPLATPEDKEKNKKDGSFQKNFGLTFYEMALFHQQTAMVIDLHFMPAAPVVEAKPDVVPDAAQAAAPLPQQQSLRASIAPNVLIFQPPEPPIVKVGLTFEMLQAVRDSELKLESQFASFVNYLELYDLSKEQKGLFNTYTGVIIMKLNMYTNARFNTSGVPTVLWARTHLKEANELKQEILEAKSPKQQMAILFEYWKTLSGNASYDLKTIVADCLSEMINMLCVNAKSRKELDANREPELKKEPK